MYFKVNICFIFLLVIGCAVARHRISFSDILSNDLEDDDWDSDDSYDSDEDTDDDSTCTLTPFPPKPDSACCGIDVTSNNKIIGGEPTLLKQYPWLALIEFKGKTNNVTMTGCGGSLISGRYVLTAAHCVTGPMFEYVSLNAVILGDYDKYHSGPDCVFGQDVFECNAGELRMGVEKVIAHKKYDPQSLSYDIALLRLNATVPYSDTIRPICLPSLDLNMKKQKDLWLFVAGWGTAWQQEIKPGQYVNIDSHVKQHLAVPYVDLSVCRESWKPTRREICAGGVMGENSCKGDSGGPLMYNNDGLFELTGIVSYGQTQPCALGNSPNVYTNVYRYRKWIDANIVC